MWYTRKNKNKLLLYFSKPSQNIQLYEIRVLVVFDGINQEDTGKKKKKHDKFQSKLMLLCCRDTERGCFLQREFSSYQKFSLHNRLRATFCSSAQVWHLESLGSMYCLASSAVIHLLQHSLTVSIAEASSTAIHNTSSVWAISCLLLRSPRHMWSRETADRFHVGRREKIHTHTHTRVGKIASEKIACFSEHEIQYQLQQNIIRPAGVCYVCACICASLWVSVRGISLNPVAI